MIWASKRTDKMASIASPFISRKHPHRPRAISVPISRHTSAVFVLLCLLQFGKEVCGLKMLGIDGPTSADRREQVTLICRYDLQRDTIYSMKWFKDDKEIHRYIPTDAPEYKAFNRPGIKINTEATKPTNLVFNIVSPLASGTYKCEITTETPSFRTLQAELNFTVVVPPRLGPSISGIADFYYPDDHVLIACVSRDSKPAPTLTWTLNDKSVPDSYMEPYNKTVNESTGLESAERVLNFHARDAHFPGGELKLKCTAEIEDVWSAHIDGVALGGSKGMQGGSRGNRGVSNVVKMGVGGFGGGGPNSLHTRGATGGSSSRSPQYPEKLLLTLLASFVYLCLLK